MAKLSVVTVVAISLLSCSLFACCYAHSNVGKPLAYNPMACKASERWCKGACPPMWKTGGSRFRNTPKNPSAVWKRGQEVEIIWHKNNHIGGFYRRSLVPVKHMFEKSWHDQTAFDFGCWGQGTFKCGKNDVCGADLKSLAYKNKVVIPDVFPDGDYVFGQVWYGGLYWRGTFPKYSDYWSCSYVRIKGGNPLKSSAVATWTGSKRTCRTGSTRPNQCNGEACAKNPVRSLIPDEFANGKKPKVYLKTLDTEMKYNGVKATDAGMKEAMEDMKKAEAADKQAGLEEAKQVKPAAPTTDTTTAVIEEEPTKSDSSGTKSSDLKSVNVYVDKKFVKAVYDGKEAVIDTEGKDVAIEVFTAGKKVGKVTMLTNKKVVWRDFRGPYVLGGNNGKNFKKWNKPILNKKFNFSAFITQKGKKVYINVYLTLKK